MNKPGLVLSGGGSRGSYQIGAYRALRDNGIEICAVVGTSIGAINGAYIAQGDLNLACDVWEHIDYHTVFAETRGLLMDVEPLRTLLNETIDEDAVRHSPIRYGLTTYNLSDMKMEYLFIEDIPQGKLVDFIMASSNVPIFKRVVIDNKRYLDGGVYDPLPRKMLYDAGCHDMITIMIDINPISASDRIKYENLKELRITHSADLGHFLSVDPVVIRQNYDMGYYDALRALSQYEGGYYYLIPKNYRSVPLARAFNKRDIRPLVQDRTARSILNGGMTLRRLLIHLTLTRYWKSNYTMTWNELFTACAELTGELLSIPRYNALTLYELIKQILDSTDFIEASDSFQKHDHASLGELILTGQADFIRKEYAAVALAENLPAITALLPALILAVPDVVIAALFLKVIKNRRRTQ